TTFVPRSTSDLETAEQHVRQGGTNSLVADAASQPSHWDQCALASGAVFVVVMLALAPLAPMPPGVDASPGQISDWYESHRSAVLMHRPACVDWRVCWSWSSWGASPVAVRWRRGASAWA